jgi:uncharacterized membrane-anchored protein
MGKTSGSKSVGKWILAGSALLLLVAVNFTIYSREQLLANGRVVLLELAPVDPRSLMQGDYMALRFQLENHVSSRRDHSSDSVDGRIVVTVDERGVGKFKRVDDAMPLGPNEVKMRYRVRGPQVKFATNAFFFQEGHAQYYEQAKYGEFRVAPEGEMILTRMRGADLAVLGPAASLAQ